MTSLKDQLEAVDEQLDALDLQVKELKQTKAEILKQSLDASDEDAWMIKMELESIEINERTPLPSRKLGWKVDHVSWGEKCEPFKASWRSETGAWVKVRPCGKEYEGKTYLGILLGDVALSVSFRYSPETRTIGFEPAMHNPAMYIPDLKKIVYGCGSWWGVIEGPEDPVESLTQTSTTSGTFAPSRNSQKGRFHKKLPTQKVSEVRVLSS